MNEDEKILMALANPITWVWTTELNSGGTWQGVSSQAQYEIYAPESPGNVDMPPRRRSWNVRPSLESPSRWYYFPVPSETLAKEICLRHALTGNTSELDALQDAGEAAERHFETCEKIAYAQLFAPWQRYKPARLHWKAKATEPLKIMADGARGSYTACFDRERRWIVTFLHAGNPINEHCFLTRTILKRACALHAQTGEWHATL